MDGAHCYLSTDGITFDLKVEGQPRGQELVPVTDKVYLKAFPKATTRDTDSAK